MKKLTIVIFLSIILNSLFLIHVSAQSASDSAVTDEVVKENIKERLEKVAKESTSGAVLAATQKRAWTGTLNDISNHTLSIKTDDTTRQAEVATTAKVIGTNRQSLKIGDLEIGKFIIAMGYLTDKGVLDARRIVVSTPPTNLVNQAFLVKITKIVKSTITVTVDDNKTLELNLDKNAKLTQTSSGNQSDIEVSDLREADQLVLIGSPDPKTPSILNTPALHLVSQRQIISESPSATPSATPLTKPSPKASPKSSPTE